MSDYSKKEIVELLGVHPDKIRVTRLAADPVFFETLSPAAVATVKRKYGLPDAALKREGRSEALVLVGSGGDVNEARALAISLGLLAGRDVFFLERIHGDLPALYAGAALFTTLAWKETFCFRPSRRWPLAYR